MQIPPSLVNEHYDDRYFDVVNAIYEAKQIFFRGNMILEKLTENNSICIGETGFGTGRMLLALMDYLTENHVQNATVTYNTVELHPITVQRMASILDCFRDTHAHLIDQLAATYATIDLTQNGWHTVHFAQSFGTLSLNLWIGEALEMVTALDKPCDVWFLDGHGPKKNPSMWRQELLSAVGDKTKTGGTCATYTVAGAVKRGLQDAGFSIEIVPGCGGKKESLNAIKI